jgi:hypothetical protein
MLNHTSDGLGDTDTNDIDWTMVRCQTPIYKPIYEPALFSDRDIALYVSWHQPGLMVDVPPVRVEGL